MSDPQAPTTPPPPPPYPQAAYQQTNAQPSSYAIASLVLGILGFVMLPIIGSILAIVFSGMAEKEIAASGGTIGGKGFADAGRVLGIIGLVLGVIVIALIIIAFVVLDWHVVRLERFEIRELGFFLNR